MGLQNLGNTCYLSAVIQALCHCPILVDCVMRRVTRPRSCAGTDVGALPLDPELVASSSRDDATATANATIMQKRLLCAILDLVGDSWRGRYQAATPHTMVGLLRVCVPSFSGSTQQDAHEALRYVLDTMHDAMAVVRPDWTLPFAPRRRDGYIMPMTIQCGAWLAGTQKLPARVPHVHLSPLWLLGKLSCGTNALLAQLHTRGVLPPPAGADAAAPRWVARSVISDAFQGHLESSIQCGTCGHRSSRREVVYDVSLPIPNRGAATPSPQLDLEECFRAFTEGERMEGDNQWECSRCNVRRDAVKSLALCHPPQVLCLHLKRFQSRQDGTLRKLQASVKFPLEGLDATPLMTKDTTEHGVPASNYRLFAVVRHTGKLEEGHYVAVVRHHVTGEWLFCDDEKVSPVARERVQQMQPYVLFYEHAGSGAGMDGDMGARETMWRDTLRPGGAADPCLDAIPTPPAKRRAKEEAGAAEGGGGDVAEVPSADSAVLPSDWVGRWRWLADPGPVDTGELVGADGALLLPQQQLTVEAARAWYDPVPAWFRDRALEMHGSVGRQLRTWGEVMEALELRKEGFKRRDRIRAALQACHHSSVSGPKAAAARGPPWYVVGTAWHKLMVMYLAWDEAVFPGPVDNTELLQADGGLVQGLRRGTDYRVVPPKEWEAVVEAFGRPERTIRCAQPDLSECAPEDVVIEA